MVKFIARAAAGAAIGFITVELLRAAKTKVEEKKMEAERKKRNAR